MRAVATIKRWGMLQAIANLNSQSQKKKGLLKEIFWILNSQFYPSHLSFITNSQLNMDTVISSSSSLVVRSSLPPVRTVSSPSKLYSAIASFSFTPSTNGLRRNHLPPLRLHSLISSTVPRLSIRCGAGIKEIKESEFRTTVLESNRPVLVEFVATWCGPCRLISPAMESIALVFVCLLICLFSFFF